MLPLAGRPRRVRQFLRSACVTGSLAALSFHVAGCGSMMTTAAIHKFQSHLEEGDIEGIAAATTDRFRESALPNPAALATFELLGVPAGELTIDEVIETSATTQDVLVSVEGSARKLTYHMSKTPDRFGRSKWLVDEITIRQGSKSKAVEKTVSEQMQLLLGVRDCVRAWQRADPETIARHAGPKLAERLDRIPSNWRRQLAENYFAGVLNSKPRATLVDGEAEVQLSHKEGQLRLILERSPIDSPVRVVRGQSGDSHEAALASWKNEPMLAGRDADETDAAEPLDDLSNQSVSEEGDGVADLAEVDSESTRATGYDTRPWIVKTAVLVGRGKEIVRELRREADVLVAVSEFTTSYDRGDRQALEAIASRDFYTNVLGVADTRRQPLNAAAVVSSKYDVRFGDVGNDLTAEVDGVVTQFSLTSDTGVRNAASKVDQVTRFRDGQAVRLSAELLALPTVAMFNEALNSGDVARIKYFTSQQWQGPIWERFREDRYDVLSKVALPLFSTDSLAGGEPPMIRYDGENVEVRQITESALVAYKLTTSSHRLVLEDVEVTDLNGVMTLRPRLAAMCTLDQMADGILTGDTAAIGRASTAGLNRLAWSLTAPEELPASLDLIPLLKGHVHSIESSETQTVVTISDDRPLARFLLTADGTQIDDIVYLDGSGLETKRFGQLVRLHRMSQVR